MWSIRKDFDGDGTKTIFCYGIFSSQSLAYSEVATAGCVETVACENIIERAFGDSIIGSGLPSPRIFDAVAPVVIVRRGNASRGSLSRSVTISRAVDSTTVLIVSP